MPSLINGMEQTTGQESDDYQRAIEASLGVEKDVHSQNEVEKAGYKHAMKESSAQIEAKLSYITLFSTLACPDI